MRLSQPILSVIVFSILFLEGGLFSDNAFSGEPSSQGRVKKVILKSISGAKAVPVFKGSQNRQVKEGDELEYGEELKTPEGVSLVLLYSDASQVNVSPKSDFTIEEYTDGTQWNKLREGTVRALISKVVIPKNNKPKFLIRTRSAVLGVRGTEFVMVMDLGSSTAQVHTLEGTVEVAKDELTVLNGKGALIKEGQFIEGGPHGLSLPQSFNKQEFLERLDSSGSQASQSKALESEEQVSSSHSEPQSAHESSVPQPMPAPTRFPEPSPKEDPRRAKDEVKGQKEAEKSEVSLKSRERLSLLSFQAGIFFTQLNDSTLIRAASLSWAPSMVIPYLPFLAVRGNFGGNFAADGSLNNGFLVMEYQVFLVLKLFDLFYVEGGLGEQIWRGRQRYDAGLSAVNFGVLVKLGIIDKIFAGYQCLNYQPVFNEYKAGIGIKF